MAANFIVDHDLQKPNLKHFCKICKKGFGCGRALGGHMRAHGIADDSTTAPTIDDDDPATSDLDENNNKPNLGPTNRRMYALRTNPNRLKTCRVCENCGKEFLSWKSFLEHGKCTTTSDDIDSLLSSPPYSDDDCTAAGRRGSGNNNNNNNNWSKRKRSLRVKVGSPASNEEEDLANCLMMLSNGTVEPMLEEREAEAEAEESCASASKEDHHLLHQDHHHHSNNHDNNNNNIRKPINFIPPLSYRLPDQDKAKAAAPKGMFECKACKKVFNSHQALGGHRASHKKVKGCFAARLDHMDLDARENDDAFEDSFFPTKPNNNPSVFQYENGLGNSTMASTSKRKTKVHECSICHRIFSSGQALGGHKRCHWITSNAAATEAPPPPSIAKIHQFHDQRVGPPPFDSTSAVVLPLDLKLDLNLPAPADEVRRPAFDVSTEIYLQSWVCKNDKVDENDPCEQQQQQHPNDKDNVNNDSGNNVIIKNEEENNSTKNKNNNNSIIINNNNNVEDEADSKVKLAKLSELKDMNMSGGNSSPWLQVGIGSTTDVRDDP